MSAARPAADRAGWAYALAATLAFSAVTPLGKAVVAAGVPAAAIVVFRLVISVALLGLTLAARGGLGRLRVNRRVLLVAAVVGVTNGLGMLSYFASLDYIDSSVASMIFSLSPLVTLLLLALRGEAFTRRHTLRLGLGLAGVYLLIGPGGQVDLRGVLLAGVSIITVPVQLVVIQWFLPDGDPQASSFYMMTGMCLTALAGWWLEGHPWVRPDLAGWLSLISITLIGTYLGRLLMFVAVQRVGGGQFGLLAPVETLLTVIWSVLFLHEQLTPLQWAGGGLILLSAALALERLGRLRLRLRRGRLSAEAEPE